VRGATASALLTFLSACVMVVLATSAGETALGLMLLAIGAVASGWRSTFRARLQPRHPERMSARRVRLELHLNAALTAGMWAAASLWLLPALEPAQATAYLALLALALCTSVVHLASIRGAVETSLALQLGCLLPAVLSSEQNAWVGLLCLALAYWGLVMTARRHARSIVTAAGRLARSHAARRLLARRQHARARRRADRALLESAEARALFVAKVSHDLRTPLQIIASATELLELRASRPASSPEAILEPTQRIAHASELLIELSTELTDFLRWSSASVPVRHTRVDLAQLTRQLLESIAPRARSKGLCARFEGEPGMPVDTDPARVRTIVLNLLGNAIKYADQGELVLAVERVAAGRVRLRVQDQGPGLPEPVLRQFGRPWTTAADAVPHEGFGLGLFIVHSLASELALPMQVHSSSAGTTYCFEFDPATD
jgi:signal transduction histidine kinase